MDTRRMTIFVNEAWGELPEAIKNEMQNGKASIRQRLSVTMTHQGQEVTFRVNHMGVYGYIKTEVDIFVNGTGQTAPEA